MSARTGYENCPSTSTNHRNGHKSSRKKKHKKNKKKNKTMIIHSSNDNEIEEEEEEYEEEYDEDYNEEYEDNEYYGDDMDNIDYYNENENEYEDDDEYENEEEQYYDDWDENYEEYYDDTHYAQSPPKKKKYRQSDLNIKPLSYNDAKKQKNKQTKDKYEKRYSKYDSIIIFDDDDSDNDDEKNNKNNKNNKLVSKRNSFIELSVTNEIDDQSVTVQSKEISIFYNKKTKDKYNEFEMNIYSSDSTSDSDIIANKYLNKNDPITPAPDIIDKKYQLNGYKKQSEISDTDTDTDIKNINNKKQQPIKSVYIKKKLKPSKQQQENDIITKKKKKTNNKQPIKKNLKKTKNIFTLKEFMNVDLKTFVRDNDGDNFDVAKAICKYYDNKCDDTDTVTIVSDTKMGPNTAYWSKGDYNRIEHNCLGKYIMIYRACKHVNGNIKVKQDIFESCVKGLCMDNLGHSQLIADKLDCIFGEGCHVSLASHDQFEVFCRYSDGYICEVELPSNDFVVAWRR